MSLSPETAAMLLTLLGAFVLLVHARALVAAMRAELRPGLKVAAIVLPPVVAPVLWWSAARAFAVAWTLAALLYGGTRLLVAGVVS